MGMPAAMACRAAGGEGGVGRDEEDVGELEECFPGEFGGGDDEHVFVGESGGEASEAEVVFSTDIFAEDGAGIGEDLLEDGGGPESMVVTGAGSLAAEEDDGALVGGEAELFFEGGGVFRSGLPSRA